MIIIMKLEIISNLCIKEKDENIFSSIFRSIEINLINSIFRRLGAKYLYIEKFSRGLLRVKM